MASPTPADGFGPVDASVAAAREASAIPGAAYAVVEGGTVVHGAAFGVAGPGEAPMTLATPVVIGSVGKSLTALAIRQLVVAGRVDVNAPVTRYLPWFTLGDPGATARVTIRALLDHRSGLSTADGQDPRWYAPGLSAGDVARGLATVRPDHPAGTYAYSNANYVLLGLVVEAASGETYEAYLRTHVFEPLGMRHSFASLEAAETAGPAQGHRYLFGATVPFDEPYPTAMVAAGYQVSTAEDMARFVAALANGGMLDGRDIVGAGGTERAPAAPYDTSWQPIGALGAGAIVSQSGSTLSSNADIMVVPGTGRGVVVLLNANPTQLLGLPAGAADMALEVHRLWTGGGPGASAPSVRMVYLVADLVLVGLVAAFLVHLARARSWSRRLAGSGHPRLLIGRTIAADAGLPLLVLVSVPLWIGSTGSSRSGDLPGGWAFALWTVPDVSWVLLALSVGALLVGSAKAWSARLAGAVRAPEAGTGDHAGRG